ncbi:hypothetical protein [Maribacter sp. 2307ULW6-5]
MKKLFALISIFVLIVAAGCDYDDSDDLDILIPNDTTQTGAVLEKAPE